MSIAPTGKQVQVTGIWIHRLAGEKIVESWNVWDTLGMLQQLGVVAHLQQAQ
jgi:predicted ester cyclase